MASEATGASGLPTSRVAVASGMVAAQVGCTPDAAIRLMSERAATTNRTVEEIAAAVIDGTVRLDG